MYAVDLGNSFFVRTTKLFLMKTKFLLFVYCFINFVSMCLYFGGKICSSWRSSGTYVLTALLISLRALTDSSRAVVPRFVHEVTRPVAGGTEKRLVDPKRECFSRSVGRIVYRRPMTEVL